MTPTYIRVAAGLLGGIYLVSGLSKLSRSSRGQFTQFIRALYPKAARPSVFLFAVICWELVLGVVLLTGWGPVSLWLLLSMVTLTVFTVALVTGARSPVPLSCACFGPLSRGPIGPADVFRNVILLVVTGVVGALSAEVGWYLAGSAGCALLLAGWAAVSVSSSTGSGTQPGFTPPIFSALPDHLLHPVLASSEGADAGPVDAHENSTITHILVLFVSPGCGGCERALTALQRLTLRCSLVIVVDPSGPPGSWDAMAEDLRSQGRRVLDLAVGREVQQELQVSGYPSHLLLGPTGQTLDTGIATSELLATVETFSLATNSYDESASSTPRPRA